MNNFSGKELHIVSFNVPYPADYGGVIDVFYKIRALHRLGIKIHLHCYHYGRDEAQILNEFCSSVNYYPRKKFYQALYSSVPYIVGSRQSGELLNNLSADEHPVLFEGLHTCLYLSHPALKHKMKVVRMHNVEWEYYRSLKEAERNYLIKFYYYTESEKLKKFEGMLRHADAIMAISRSDEEYLKHSFNNITYLPAFHSNEAMDCLTGKGDYVLYHGNLSVVENNQAAVFIARKVAEGLKVPFKIAGRDPLPSLIKEIKGIPNVELISNPGYETIYELIRNAHINLLPTFQATGIKLKLLNALFLGRHCMVTSKMVEHTGLEPACICADQPSKLKTLITDYMDIPFTEADLENRKQYLEPEFMNSNNAERLARAIFSNVPKP